MTHRSGGNTRHVEPDSTSRVGEGRRAVGAVGTVCGDHCDDYDRGIGVRSWISEKRQGVTGDGKLIGYELKMGQSSSARLYTLSGPSHHVVLQGLRKHVSFILTHLLGAGSTWPTHMTPVGRRPERYASGMTLYESGIA